MADGYTAMQAMIAKLRKLGQAPEQIAADLAPALRDEFSENIAASRGPDGTPWKPTRAGTPPLANAAQALGVASVGTKIIAAVRGIEARHHFGTVKGKVGRPILPTHGLTKQLVELITAVATKRWRLIMGGGA